MHFGPDAGKTVSFHEIKGQFNDLSSAAVAALALARRLAGVADTEWLWVTHFEPDDRPDEPPKPPEPEGIEGRDTRRTK